MEWEENKHPRANDGKFSSKEGGGSTPAEEKRYQEKYDDSQMAEKELPPSWQLNKKYRDEEIERLGIREDKTKDKDFDYNTTDVKWAMAGAIPLRNGIFDTTTLGGFSEYDKDLSDKSNIVEITPREYFEKCAQGFKTTTEEQIKGIERDKEAINHLYNVVYMKNKRLCMPYMDFNEPNKQEGRHRMYAVAQMIGWDKKVPVLAVNGSKLKE